MIRMPQSWFFKEGFRLSQDEDSDDDPAVLSLHGMSPPGSILSDDDPLTDQIKDIKGPDRSAETEGTVTV